MAGKNKPNELRLTRVYDAPVKLVWAAWTDPERVAQWWGPRGFTLTTKSKDLRPGGKWIYTMHGPDGTDYPNVTTYHEVEKYSRLVYDHGGNEERPALFRVTVTFAEVKGKTKMEMTMALPTPEAAEETRKFIKRAGGDATWDRLAEFLDKETSGKEEFVIHRAFRCSVERMFDLWTTPGLLAQWLPPAGFTMEFRQAEIRPGGEATYVMTDGAAKMYGRMRYLEITGPGRLVYTQQFTDEGGKVARHPKLPRWPETLLTTVTLTEEEPGHTRVKMRWEPHGELAREELAAFLAAKAGMAAGWTGSFDKLEALLP